MIRGVHPSKRDPSTNKVLRIHFDPSACATLQGLLANSPSLFTKETEPASADLILFCTDEVAHVRASALYKAFPEKSFCVTESDIPTFRLPGLYASNSRSWLTRSRTRTMNYCLSQVDRPNLEVRRRIGQVSVKRYLYSFMGGPNSWTRKRLLRSIPSRPDTLIQATDSYNHWNADRSPEANVRHRERYAEVMAASRYVLCPRGCGLSSYRIFESMSLGVVRVILADDWKPVEGVDWSFALFVRERHLADIDRIVRENQSESEQRGRIAQQTYQAFFSPEVVPELLHRQLLALHATQRPVSEALMAVVTETRAAGREVYWDAYKVMKNLALRGLHLTKVPVSIPLSRPIKEQLESAKQAS